jgi:hypothetical protein
LFCLSFIKLFKLSKIYRQTGLKGVMKLVGEAVSEAEELHKYSTALTVIGIATWGTIASNDLLINTVKNEEALKYLFMILKII